MRFVYSLIVIAFFLVSCQNKKNANENALDVIEPLLKTHPDSALVLLDSVKLEYSDEYEQNRYFLFRIIAKDNSNKEIYMDKEILDIYNFFSTNDYEELACVSAFYCGKVLQSNMEYDQAVTYYYIAEAISKATNNKAFQGEVLYALGNLMIDRFIMDEAESLLMQANSIFKETGNHKLEIKSQRLMAFYQLICEDFDSALIFSDKALDLAIKNNYTEEQASTLLTKGIILSEKDEHLKAINAYKEVMSIDSIVFKSGKVFINLAESYSAIGMIDSARYYAERGLVNINNNKTEDYYSISSMYQTYSALEEKGQNYKKALALHKEYSKNLAEVIGDIRDKGMIDAQKNINMIKFKRR